MIDYFYPWVMAFHKYNLVFTYVLLVPFMTLIIAAELHNMTIQDYITYINPAAVHGYKHKNGDSILCVKFTDQISLNPAQHYEHGKKSSNTSWMNAEEGKPSMNISDNGLQNRCPEGTVSVMEIKYDQVKAAGSVDMFLRKRISASSTPQLVNEYATVQFQYDGVHGAQGRFNVWEPYVASDGVSSLSQIWLIRDIGLPTQQIMEAGWEVFPSNYGDSRPRLFVYWTADNYKSTGCRNLECPGFVLADSAQYYPGEPIESTSEHGKDQFEILININREILDGQPKWSLYIQNKIVGYWPGSLFSTLAESANLVEYGGVVQYYSNDKGTPLSKTDMGSGDFPEMGFSNAAYIRGMQMFNSNGELVNPLNSTLASKPLCYDVILGDKNAQPGSGDYIFFGGPGGDNPGCLN